MSLSVSLSLSLCLSVSFSLSPSPSLSSRQLRRARTWSTQRVIPAVHSKEPRYFVPVCARAHVYARAGERMRVRAGDGMRVRASV